MRKNNYPFGSTIIKDFKEGDLVYWNEWKVIDKELNKKKKFGVFVETSTKFISNREVMYASVVSAETGDLLEVLAVRLKKEETT
jgi:hypothetical protein